MQKANPRKNALSKSAFHGRVGVDAGNTRKRRHDRQSTAAGTARDDSKTGSALLLLGDGDKGTVEGRRLVMPPDEQTGERRKCGDATASWR